MYKFTIHSYYDEKEKTYELMMLDPMLFAAYGDKSEYDTLILDMKTLTLHGLNKSVENGDLLEIAKHVSEIGDIEFDIIRSEKSDMIRLNDKVQEYMSNAKMLRALGYDV